MKKDEIYIYGAGGFGKVVCDIIRIASKQILIVFIDDDKNKTEWYGKPVIKSSDVRVESKIALAIGDNVVRQNIIENKDFFDYQTILHEKTFVSSSASIGKGCIVLSFCTINAESKIGIACILNSNCVIDHNAIIGNFVHLRHNVIVNAEAIIEDNCFIGENTIVERGAIVKKGSTIKANSVVYNEY